MATINIPVSDEELTKLAKAICELGGIKHVRAMSRSMLANTSGLNQNKVRAVLQELLDRHLAIQYQATQNPQIQRYYYVLTDAGKALLEEVQVDGS